MRWRVKSRASRFVGVQMDPSDVFGTRNWVRSTRCVSRIVSFFLSFCDLVPQVIGSRLRNMSPGETDSMPSCWRCCSHLEASSELSARRCAYTLASRASSFVNSSAWAGPKSSFHQDDSRRSKSTCGFINSDTTARVAEGSFRSKRDDDNRTRLSKNSSPLEPPLENNPYRDDIGSSWTGTGKKGGLDTRYVVDSPKSSFHGLGVPSVPKNVPDELLMFPRMSVGSSKLFHSKLNLVNLNARSLMSTHFILAFPDDRTARLKAWIPEPHPKSIMLSVSLTCCWDDQWSISALYKIINTKERYEWAISHLNIWERKHEFSSYSNSNEK